MVMTIDVHKHVYAAVQSTVDTGGRLNKIHFKEKILNFA